jgi:hypothetical protein
MASTLDTTDEFPLAEARIRNKLRARRKLERRSARTPAATEHTLRGDTHG